MLSWRSVSDPDDLLMCIFTLLSLCLLSQHDPLQAGQREGLVLSLCLSGGQQRRDVRHWKWLLLSRRVAERFTLYAAGFHKLYPTQASCLAQCSILVDFCSEWFECSKLSKEGVLLCHWPCNQSNVFIWCDALVKMTHVSHTDVWFMLKPQGWWLKMKKWIYFIKCHNVILKWQAWLYFTPNSSSCNITVTDAFSSNQSDQCDHVHHHC